MATQNQIALRKVIEEERHNRWEEAETEKHNRETERFTAEHYRQADAAALQQAWASSSQAETAASNAAINAQNSATNRYNAETNRLNYIEQSRHSKVVERETSKHNREQEELSRLEYGVHARSQAESERSNRARELETNRANVTSENLRRQEIAISEAAQKETVRSHKRSEELTQFSYETERRKSEEQKRHDKATEEISSREASVKESQLSLNQAYFVEEVLNFLSDRQYKQDQTAINKAEAEARKLTAEAAWQNAITNGNELLFEMAKYNKERFKPKPTTKQPDTSVDLDHDKDGIVTTTVKYIKDIYNRFVNFIN